MGMRNHKSKDDADEDGTIGERALRAACRHFYGNPITGMSELLLLDYMSKVLPREGAVFCNMKVRLKRPICCVDLPLRGPVS